MSSLEPGKAALPPPPSPCDSFKDVFSYLP
jgi:hypothetical protein